RSHLGFGLCFFGSCERRGRFRRLGLCVGGRLCRFCFRIGCGFFERGELLLLRLLGRGALARRGVCRFLLLCVSYLGAFRRLLRFLRLARQLRHFRLVLARREVEPAATADERNHDRDDDGHHGRLLRSRRDFLLQLRFALGKFRRLRLGLALGAVCGFLPRLL